MAKIQNRWILLFVWFACPPAISHAVANHATDARERVESFVANHCLDCHNTADVAGGLSIEDLLDEPLVANPRQWENILHKIKVRQMPPPDMSPPRDSERTSVTFDIAAILDANARIHPNPGMHETLRRLTRTEYQNAIRDLLGLDIDASRWLPADPSSHGFDNITVTTLTPTLMERYVKAAEAISRLAVAASATQPKHTTFRMRPDVTQDRNRVPGLPFGTRGGMLIKHHFPQQGIYEVQVRLMRDRNDEIEGLRGKHQLEILLDREPQASFDIQRPTPGENDRQLEAGLTTRFTVTAGTHHLGVTFVKKAFSLIESERQPLNVHYNFYRHPRLGPAVYQVTISGPYEASGPGETKPRQRIFTVRPSPEKDDLSCAREIFGTLMLRAYRRPLTPQDFETPMRFYRDAAAGGDFERGIARGLASILVSPHFLFRIESNASGMESSKPHPVQDTELASRLAFFLWSSLPDDTLLDLAEQQQLGNPETLRQQVLRMLRDPRATSLVTNFANQWLQLRNLSGLTPDARAFPDFDDNLRTAFQRETELLFQDMMEHDRSILSLLKSDFTYLNERLARHYAVTGVQGSHFRRVDLPPNSRRGGVLRHGSILSLTSYATRTSPVLRGTWILENILGSPTPPPPPNVPTLEDNTVDANLPIRERLAAHRANTACAACHDLIDPVGFSMEQFDAVGRWRTMEAGSLVDATGGLPGFGQFEGVAGLEEALLDQPELFASAFSEKLLTFALGRGVEYYDAPAIRKIVADSRPGQFKFSDIILGIVESVPFRMSRAAPPPTD